MSDSGSGGGFETIAWGGDHVRLIDQTLLPAEYRIVELRTVPEICEAIRVLRVRGAPAIGCAAAYGLALRAVHGPEATPEELLPGLESAARELAATRPTAVNLFWAIDRIMSLAGGRSWSSLDELRQALVDDARSIQAEDDAACRAIGAYGAGLLPDPCRILTHCNAGGLATSGYGTAVGVIRAAHEQGKRVRVWVDETRPLLQGARLTAWELSQLEIPATLITDSMAAHVMARGQVDAVVVGADRIAANGDVANKIGTQGVAILAEYFGVPFYVAAPLSTVDLSLPTGAGIPIEERSADEVTTPRGTRFAPELTATLTVYNPAFDVTPAHLIRAIVTEKGVLHPPYGPALARWAGSK
ncbi:MAG TPA: S-methyl-5-thioribose-1-phosphate isomerase [Armatimonadota bacterium]|nr:S-methyl-5-thioribose-1-phosphate isomerase [Armatimonadota bacterium]